MKKNLQNGFTVIELLVATAIFSFFLLLMSMMTIRIGQLFQKGVILAKTQEAARVIITDISRSIQFSGSDVSSGIGYICAGSNRYQFTLGKQVVEGAPNGDQTNHALIVDSPATCAPGPAVNPQKELVPVNMRLAALSVTPPNGSSGLFTITVRVVYGDVDLLDDPTGPTARCKNGIAGTQFCGSSELTTTVEKRL